MDYYQLNVKLQVKNGFKLVHPYIGHKIKEDIVLNIIKNGISLPGKLFNGDVTSPISIDMSTGKPRLLINPPAIYSGWTARKCNNHTTRYTVTSKTLASFLKAALKIPKTGKITCRLIGPHLENGVILYDIKK